MRQRVNQSATARGGGLGSLLVRAWLGVCLLGIGAIPFLTKPLGWVWRQYEGWFTLLTGPAQIRHTYRDTWTIWEAIHPPVHPTVYMVLQLTTAAVVLGLCLWQARRGLPVKRLLLFILVMWACWQLLLGPATERNTFGLIAPLSSWALLTALEQRRGRIVMGLAFVLMTTATFGIIERWLVEDFPLVLIFHPIGVLLFAGWFLRWNHVSWQPTADEGTTFVLQSRQRSRWASPAAGGRNRGI